ncbi:flavin reductase family protein [Deltaproteobacteria bacterium]|nr:flavin reductase family protein [Deltaproteobacteria bacterium]
MFKTAGNFALNVLGKGQQGAAYAFFKPAERDGQNINGEPFRVGSTGAPVLENTPAFVECRLVTTVEEGDHSIFVREVVVSGLTQEPEGRADKATLLQKDLGEKTFYGG